jgi:mannose/fructose/N-acetylgalactosamine-specific phosphotransferase system component IID
VQNQNKSAMLDQEVQAYSQLIVSMGNSTSSDFRSLNSKLTTIADAYTEQTEELQMLKSDLKFYQRREPLVHVLWAEISRLREQVGEAVAQGYAISLEAPTRRIGDSADDSKVDLSNAGLQQYLGAQVCGVFCFASWCFSRVWTLMYSC